MGTLKPTLRLRKLGLALRHHREAAGLTLDDAAALLNRHPSSISRIEKGLHHVPVRDVEYYLIKYGVTDPAEYTRLYDLSRNARQKGWWHKYKGDLSHQAMDLISLECDAMSISFFEVIVVPGLMQTVDYARDVIRQGTFITDSGHIDRLVDIRMRRQNILVRPEPPVIAAIVDEAALRRQVGSRSIMRAQLARLAELAILPRMSIQVLPFSAGAYRGMSGAFSMIQLGRPSDLQLITVGSLTDVSYREKDAEIRAYSTTFTRLSETALSLDDSRALIERLMSEI